MKTKESESDPFYVGYLPAAPAVTARFVRRVVISVGVIVLGAGVWFAIALPYFGAGEFEFGRVRTFEGTLQCDSTPRLGVGRTDYLLVGAGKHGVPPELCGEGDARATIAGTLIRRDGRELIEVETVKLGERVTPPPRIELGRFTLSGEIVDSKCYFGVMNPAEGRVHRACAELCLRGGIPAVLVARDRSGAIIHVVLSGEGSSNNEKLLPWVGEPVEVSGEVTRVGRWLTMKPEFGSLRFARRQGG